MNKENEREREQCKYANIKNIQVVFVDNAE